MGSCTVTTLQSSGCPGKGLAPVRTFGVAAMDFRP
jgi:hypothetical protein